MGYGLAALALQGSCGAVAAETLALFGGTASPNSAYAYAGALFPLGVKLGDPGFVARVWLAGIQFDYDAGAPIGEVRGRGPEAEVALGRLWKSGNGSLTLYGSVRYREIDLDPDDPASDTEDEHWGAGVQAEYTQRFSAAWSFNAIGSYTALVANYWTRFRPAYAIGERSIGPELIFTGGDEYVAQRYGIFLDGISIGALRMDVSGGFDHQRGESTHAYAALSFSVLF